MRPGVTTPASHWHSAGVSGAGVGGVVLVMVHTGDSGHGTAHWSLLLRLMASSSGACVREC